MSARVWLPIKVGIESWVSEVLVLWSQVPPLRGFVLGGLPSRNWNVGLLAFIQRLYSWERGTQNCT